MKNAKNSVATLYLQSDAIRLDQSSGFMQGDEVMTVYGQGYVEEVRERDGCVVVKLNDWKLAQGMVLIKDI